MGLKQEQITLSITFPYSYHSVIKTTIKLPIIYSLLSDLSTLAIHITWCSLFSHAHWCSLPSHIHGVPYAYQGSSCLRNVSRESSW